MNEQEYFELFVEEHALTFNRLGFDEFKIVDIDGRKALACQTQNDLFGYYLKDDLAWNFCQFYFELNRIGVLAENNADTPSYPKMVVWLSKVWAWFVGEGKRFLQKHNLTMSTKLEDYMTPEEAEQYRLRLKWGWYGSGHYRNMNQES